MNYMTHSLRTNLIEWRSRIARSFEYSFNNKVNYFLQRLDLEPKLKSLLIDAHIRQQIPLKDFEFFMKSLQQGQKIIFETEEREAVMCYLFLNKIIEKNIEGPLTDLPYFKGKNFDDKQDRFIDNFISPIVNYLEDKLDSTNSITYVLEKYKKRVEWFTKGVLYDQYQKSDKNYEDFLANDLRLFLFDQGIEYPFSKPHTFSGKADIVGNIDTSDPLILEAKIFDKSKGYGKDRIIDGFRQIVDYTEEYNKNEGYLVIFNMDSSDKIGTKINLSLPDSEESFPHKLMYNNKYYYFIVIQAGLVKPSSKKGKIKEVTIRKEELISSLERPN